MSINIKLLRIVSPRFVAGAIFEKINGHWQCTKSAPILYKHFVGKPMTAIKQYLDKHHLNYEWI